MGEDVDAKGQDGATPLRCAVQEGHARVVEILLGRGASFLDKDEDGLSMLHCAASEGHQVASRHAQIFFSRVQNIFPGGGEHHPDPRAVAG